MCFKEYVFCIIFIFLSFTKLAGMDVMNVPTKLQEDLKKNKTKILVIMTTHTDKKVDLGSIGTFYNSIKMFFYLDDEKIRKSIPYYVIEKIIDSDDEEFNIEKMYDGQIFVPQFPSDTTPLNPRDKAQNCCLFFCWP